MDQMLLAQINQVGLIKADFWKLKKVAKLVLSGLHPETATEKVYVDLDQVKICNYYWPGLVAEIMGTWSKRELLQFDKAKPVYMGDDKTKCSKCGSKIPFFGLQLINKKFHAFCMGNTLNIDEETEKMAKKGLKKVVKTKKVVKEVEKKEKKTAKESKITQISVVKSAFAENKSISFKDLKQKLTSVFPNTKFNEISYSKYKSMLVSKK